MADDAHIERSTYFFNAIGKGDFEVVKAMLSNGFDVDTSIIDDGQKRRKRSIKRNSVCMHILQRFPDIRYTFKCI